MTFDSVSFWIFFAVAWAAWRFLPFRAAKASALVMSLFFYAWWNPGFVVLIVFSSAVDYFVGFRLFENPNPRSKKMWVTWSLFVNLGLLAVFKYGAFAIDNSAGLAQMLGYDVDWQLTNWVIPVGISFYTFQTLSYSLDIYRGKLTPAKSFLDFFLYVAFFPQLVAGPIVRARELLPQFARRRKLSVATLQAGFKHVITGLFLKVVVADNLALAVDPAFSPDNVANLTPASAWLSVIYFGVQIFADFAGYSGIAIGLAYLMGLRFPENFRAPYISRGLSEFWTRWHITLSSWLRDYLYISIGGNRKGSFRTYFNLSVTMLLGGLWHGASWTFVAWGAMHGLGLVVERLMRGDERKAQAQPTGVLAGAVQMFVVFIFVQTTWVFFRAADFPTAWSMLERMYVAPFVEGFGFAGAQQWRYMLLVAPVAGMHLLQFAREHIELRPTRAWQAASVGVFLFLLTVVERKGGVAFIYFQF